MMSREEIRKKREELDKAEREIKEEEKRKLESEKDARYEEVKTALAVADRDYKHYDELRNKYLDDYRSNDCAFIRWF